MGYLCGTTYSLVCLDLLRSLGFWDVLSRYLPTHFYSTSKFNRWYQLGLQPLSPGCILSIHTAPQSQNVWHSGLSLPWVLQTSAQSPRWVVNLRILMPISIFPVTSTISWAKIQRRPLLFTFCNRKSYNLSCRYQSLWPITRYLIRFPHTWLTFLLQRIQSQIGREKAMVCWPFPPHFRCVLKFQQKLNHPQA